MVVTATADTAQVAQKADCNQCLTRSCPMNKLDNSPVTSCSSFRLANCAFCAVSDCPLNGTINAPVLNCNSFKLLGAN
jgi:hypothetical protein